MAIAKERGRGSEPARRTLEPAGRILELVGPLELAGRASKLVGMA